jgi:glutamyl-Q tRNA(Asp) synthetase
MYARILRVAPSPNGYLHLGHAYSALLNYDMARDLGGRLLLRIEDIDVSRCRPEYEAAIYQDLGWLGISWDESVRRQSEQFDDHRAALVKLEAQGLIYPSFESRSEIAALVAARDRQGHWPRDPDGVPLYSGRGAQTAGGRTRAPAPMPVSRSRCGSPWTRRSRATGVLTWTETGAGSARPDRRSSRRRRTCGATSCWRARRCRRAITSR